MMTLTARADPDPQPETDVAYIITYKSQGAKGKGVSVCDHNHPEPLNHTMSTLTTLASNTLLLRRQLAELTKHPVEGFSAGPYPTIFLHAFQRPHPDSLLREGLVDENNLYEWEIMIIGSAPSPCLTARLPSP